MNQPDYTLIIVATASIAIIAFSVILLLFPRLQGMASTESIRPTIERDQPKADEGYNRTKAVDVAMRLLEPDEKQVMEAIVAAGGSMLQKDLSHELGFSRVKIHRVLVRLIRRGVVTAEKYYNTNRIEVADWLNEKCSSGGFREVDRVLSYRDAAAVGPGAELLAAGGLLLLPVAESAYVADVEAFALVLFLGDHGFSLVVAGKKGFSSVFANIYLEMIYIY